MTKAPPVDENSELRKSILDKIHLAVRTEFFNNNRKNMDFLADDIQVIIQKAIETTEVKARIDEWGLIGETLHSAGITLELHISKTRDERLKSLTTKDKS